MDNLKTLFDKKMNQLLDITNQRFGKLIALHPTDKRLGTSIIWECKCYCGNICFISCAHLKNGDTQSCGCNSSSKGEKIIEKILKENNVHYEKEKIFSKLGKMRFDFYVDNKYIIEFDGKQHFNNNGYFESQQEIHKRDLLKNKYCFDNNILIIRIIQWDYIMLKTI